MKEYYTAPYVVYTDFLTKNCPNYFDEIYVFFKNPWSSHAFIIPKHKCPLSKNKCWTKILILYVGAHFWNNFNKTLKTLTGPNAFKRNIKQHCFNESNKKESY